MRSALNPPHRVPRNWCGLRRSQKKTKINLGNRACEADSPQPPAPRPSWRRAIVGCGGRGGGTYECVRKWEGGTGNG